MELEDAMTIFSYSSPYPVQLSLLPATAATSSVPRTLLGRRSWSVDELEARRRRRLHPGEVPRRLRLAARSHSDARRPKTDAKNSDQDKQHPVNTTGQSAHPSDQLRPSTGHDNLSTAPSTDVNLHETPSSVTEPDHSVSTDRGTAVNLQPLTVTTRTTVDENMPQMGEVCGAEMLKTSSPGSTSGSSNAAVAAGPNEDRLSDKDVVIVFEEEHEPRLEALPDVHLNKTSEDGLRSDEVPTSVAPVQRYLYNQLQQQPKDSGKSSEMTLKEAGLLDAGAVAGRRLSLPYDGRLSSVERSVDDGSSVSLVEPTSKKSASEIQTTPDKQNSQVFYEIDLNDDIDPSNTQTPLSTQFQRPASKKKRSLIGSLKSLMKSKKSPEVAGGAVAYVHPSEDAKSTSAVQQQTVVYIVNPQFNDNSVSLRHDKESRPEASVSDQHKSPEIVASESGNAPTTWIDEVLFAASNIEPHAVDLRHQRNPDRSVVEKSQADTISGPHHHQQQCRDQPEHENIMPVTSDDRNSPSARDAKLNCTKFSATAAVSSDLPKQSDQSKVADTEVIVAADGTVEATDHDLLPISPDPLRAATDEDGKQRSSVRAISDLEAEIASTQPSPLFTKDEHIVATSCVRDDIIHDDVIHDGAEVREEMTSTEASLLKPETNDVSRTIDEDDIAGMMRCNGELTAESDAATQRSQFETGLPVQQEMVDEEHGSKMIVASDEAKYGVPDAESGKLPTVLDRQHLDVNDNELCCMSVTEPTISATTSDTSQSVSAAAGTRSQVVKGKRSSENDLCDLSNDEFMYPVVSDQIIAKSTSDLSSPVSSTQPQVTKDKRSPDRDLEDDSEVSTDIPSVLTMVLNLFSEAEGAAKHTQGQYPVAMETPVNTSGESRSAPVVDDVTGSTNGEDNRHDEDGAVDAKFDKSSRSISDYSPTQKNRLSADELSLVDQIFDAISTKGRLHTHQTPTEKTSAELSSTQSSDGNSSVSESRTKLKSGNTEEVENKWDAAFLSQSDGNLPQYVDRSEASCKEPSVSKIRVSHPSLMMDGDHPNSSHIADGVRISQTTRPNFDSTQVIESKTQTSNAKTVQQPRAIGVPIIRGNRLPINSPEGASPTPEYLKRNVVPRPYAGDFTFVVQRQVKVGNNCQRSLSTGTSNSGIVSGKPAAYTFVIPTVRRRSASDYNKNNLSRYSSSSTPNIVSDGRKSDITDSLRYTVTDLNKYNPWQVVPHGRRPVRTGSGSTFDRKQINSVEHEARLAAVNGRLSESSGELRIRDDRTSPNDGDCMPPVNTSTVSPTARTVSGSLSDHVTHSVPDFKLKSISVDDVRHFEPRPDVITSYNGCDVTNDDGGQREETRDWTQSLRDVTETGSDVTVLHDICSSEPCLDVKDDDGADVTSHDLMRLRLEPLVVETGNGSAMSAREKSEEQEVGRPTVQRGSNTDGSSQQRVNNNRRRPRRRRVVQGP